MTWPSYLTIVAAVAGLLAALLLYYAGIGVPAKMQTWDSEAPHELQRERRQATLRRYGVAAAVAAAAAAIGAALTS